MGKKKKDPQPRVEPPFEARLFVLGVDTACVPDLIGVAPGACVLVQAVLQSDDSEATKAAHWLLNDVMSLLQAAAALLDGREVEITEEEIDTCDPTGNALKLLALLRVEHPDGPNHLEPAADALDLIAHRLESRIQSFDATAEARA